MFSLDRRFFLRGVYLKYFSSNRLGSELCSTCAFLGLFKQKYHFSLLTCADINFLYPQIGALFI